MPPNAAILNGNFVTPDNPTALPTASFPGIIVASLPATRLGFETPSFFLARRTEVDGNGLRVLSTDADKDSADRYITLRQPRPSISSHLARSKTAPAASPSSTCREAERRPRGSGPTPRRPPPRRRPTASRSPRRSRARTQRVLLAPRLAQRRESPRLHRFPLDRIQPEPHLRRRKSQRRPPRPRPRRARYSPAKVPARDLLHAVQRCLLPHQSSIRFMDAPRHRRRKRLCKPRSRLTIPRQDNTPGSLYEHLLDAN